MKIFMVIFISLILMSVFSYAERAEETHTMQLNYEHKIRNQHRVGQIPQPVNPPLAFIVHGDTHAGYDNVSTDVHTQIVNQILAFKPNRVFNTGDVIHGQWGGPENWNIFDSIAGEVVRTYPYYPTIGNHDQTIGIDYYLAYFNASTNTSINGTYYYTETDDAIHVVLNVNAFGEQDDFDDQKIWLDNVLSQYEDKTYKFVYFHRASYTSGGRGACTWARGFDDIFEEHNVDIVFMGHIHAYERFYINGIHYIATGGGGGVPHTLDVYHDYPYGSRQYSELTYNYVTVTGTNESIEIQGHYLNGSVFDSFNITPGEEYVPTPDEGDGGLLDGVKNKSFLNVLLASNDMSLTGLLLFPLIRRNRILS